MGQFCWFLDIFIFTESKYENVKIWKIFSYLYENIFLFTESEASFTLDRENFKVLKVNIFHFFYFEVISPFSAAL